MAKRTKKKLNIDKCIIIGDFRRAEKDLDPIKNKLKLSIELAKKLKETPNSIYSRLYRYEKDGFYHEDKNFTSSICILLDVSNKELVKNYDA